MTDSSRSPLPPAARPFHAFASALRDHGFTVVTDQVIAFLHAIGALGPCSIGDVYWAARATLAPPIERMDTFDALFDSFFRAESDAGIVAESMPEEEAPVREAGSSERDLATAEKANQSGEAASAADAPSVRSFAAMSRNDRLALMQRRIVSRAPRRRGYRRVPSRRGDRLDLRRSLSAMIQPASHSAQPAWTRRTRISRRVLLLLDISGSMKRETDDYLHFAHALTQTLPAVETFSFGTRLTRLTRSLRHRDIDRALGEIAPAVADWQGGTRIGASLQAFLSIPRFARASRGALVVVLSDGLERGDPAEMVRAVRRLAARSWRMAWLTPLAAHPDFRPETEALTAILPIVDYVGAGAGIAALCDFIEQSARLGDTAPAPGRSGGNHGNSHHRRTSSHLAPGRPSLAHGSDAAAHLRAL